MNRQPNKQVWFVDLVAILVICAVAFLGTRPSFEKIVYRLPFVTLLVFYLLGKSARDLELRLWEKRHAGRRAASSGNRGG